MRHPVTGTLCQAVKEGFEESVGNDDRNMKNRVAFCLAYIWMLLVGAAGATATQSGGFVDHLWGYVSRTSTIIVSIVVLLYAALAPVVGPVFISLGASVRPTGKWSRFTAGIYILGLTGLCVLGSGLLQGNGDMISRVGAVGLFFVTPGCLVVAVLTAAYCAWSPVVWPTGAFIRWLTARSHGRHARPRGPEKSSQ